MVQANENTSRGGGGGKVRLSRSQGILTEGEGSVRLTPLYQLVHFNCFLE
jgi:hypothetical protein